jgi:hypothetical protein
MIKAVIATLSACALFVGCDKSGDAKPAGGVDSVGIQECDDYLAKMEACFAKDPATKAAGEASVKGSRETWKKRAQTDPEVTKKGCIAALQNIPANCK